MVKLSIPVIVAAPLVSQSPAPFAYIMIESVDVAEPVIVVSSSTKSDE